MEKKNARKIGNFSGKMLTTTAWRMRTYLKVKVLHAVSVAHTLLVMSENDAAERVFNFIINIFYITGIITRRLCTSFSHVAI